MNAIVKEVDHARQNASGWASTIVELVAAMDCDYDRLSELRDEREAAKDSAYESPDVDGAFGYTGCDQDCYATLAEAEAAALAEWDSDNGEEFAQLTADATIDGEVCEDGEAARERIQESPLSVQVRSGWANPGEEMQAEEFEILLSTGGPALRIMGELDEHKQPSRAYLQYQDWGTPWTDFFGEIESSTLLTFCQQFYFGE